MGCASSLEACASIGLPFDIFYLFSFVCGYSFSHQYTITFFQHHASMAASVEASVLLSTLTFGLPVI